MSKCTSYISVKLADTKLIMNAINHGIEDAMFKHKQLGHPVVGMKDGKIIWVQPTDIVIKEKHSC